MTSIFSDTPLTTRWTLSVHVQSETTCNFCKADQGDADHTGSSGVFPLVASPTAALCEFSPGKYTGKPLAATASQSALEFCPIHCPNGRLGQDLGFGGFAFALKLPELLNRNLAAVRAKILFP